MRGTDAPIPKGKRIKDDSEGSAPAPIPASAQGKWIGCEEITVDTGRRQKRRFLLLTKGLTTYLVASPLHLDPSTPPHAPTHAAPHLVPLHTFHWPTLGNSPQSSLASLTAFISPLDDDVAFSHLTLVGFSATGLSVQEHLVSHAAVEALSTSRERAAAAAPRLVVVPLDTLPARDSLMSDEQDDPDLSDSATLDFGRETGWLCATATSRAGGYVWTRAQGEYVAKRVAVQL